MRQTAFAMLRSPLAVALFLSVLVHLAFAVYMHVAANLLPPVQLPSSSSVTDVSMVSAVLLPDDAIPARTKLKNAASTPQPSSEADAKPQTQPAAKQDDVVASKAAEIPAASDTEVLPHEELARKKEPLPPASLPPKDKPMQYSLPDQVKLSYAGTLGATPVKGTLQFAVKGNDYTASLQATASVFFKTFELKQTVQGVLNAQGLEALRAEDKAMNGRSVAITAEPDKQRVIISSKEGFLPYAPGGKDLLSVMLHLGILVQAQPEWRSKGAAQDFTVYRPSGIKRWRYQSQGVEKTLTPAGIIETVYVKRVPQSAEPDFEYIHHLWLDPARHGLPIRIQLEDAKSGRTIDLTLSQWEES